MLSLSVSDYTAFCRGQCAASINQVMLISLSFFGSQPLVPVAAAEDGQWLIDGPLSPVCKPGGHGAIWKLASDKGVFQWFYSLERKGATVRQVRLFLCCAVIIIRYNARGSFFR